MIETLQERLVALVSGASPRALDELEADLATGATTFDSSPELPGYLLVPLLRAWEKVGYDTVAPKALALALRCARQIKASTTSTSPRLDLVWTGPHSPANIRTLSTAMVLQEMIQSASHKVLVVGYTLTPHNDLSVSVVQSLADAMERGCRVIMALHDDPSNYDNLIGLWPDSVPLPRVLRWVGVPGDPKASLHAKLVVTDAADLLITSANLTFHGLEQNIEMGVRIRGSFAFEVDKHFSNLERERILIPYQGANR